MGSLLSTSKAENGRHLVPCSVGQEEKYTLCHITINNTNRGGVILIRFKW